MTPNCLACGVLSELRLLEVVEELNPVWQYSRCPCVDTRASIDRIQAHQKATRGAKESDNQIRYARRCVVLDYILIQFLPSLGDSCSHAGPSPSGRSHHLRSKNLFFAVVLLGILFLFLLALALFGAAEDLLDLVHYKCPIPLPILQRLLLLPGPLLPPVLLLAPHP